MESSRFVFFWQLTSVILLSSCINEIDLELQPITEVPVLSCVLRPYQTISVYFSRSMGIGKPDMNDVSESLVLLFEDNVLIDTLEYTTDHWFESSLSAIPGYDYEIQVWSNGNLVRGSDKVPLENKVVDLSAEAVESNNGSGDVYYNYELKFLQDSLIDEYFDISQLSVNCRDDTCGTGYLFPGPNQDPVIIAEGILDFNPFFFVFSDVLFKGNEQVVFLQFMNTTDNGAQQLVGQNLMSGRFIRFSSISKEAYLFKKSLLRYHANINTDDRLNDLKALFFGSEPSSLYSNIEGGKGMVMGVNEQYIPIKF